MELIEAIEQMREQQGKLPLLLHINQRQFDALQKSVQQSSSNPERFAPIRLVLDLMLDNDHVKLTFRDRIEIWDLKTGTSLIFPYSTPGYPLVIPAVPGD